MKELRLTRMWNENGTARSIFHLLAVPALALGTLAMGASSVSAADHQVPFRGSYSGTATFTGPASTAFSGIGNATHLGRGTNTGNAQITGPDNSTCSGGLANTNTEILTAANGDSLTITSQDVACPTGPGTYHGTGNWTVTGGTGRFSGVSGKGTLDGHSDFNQGVFQFDLNGSISSTGGG